MFPYTTPSMVCEKGSNLALAPGGLALAQVGLEFLLSGPVAIVQAVLVLVFCEDSEHPEAQGGEVLSCFPPVEARGACG